MLKIGKLSLKWASVVRAILVVVLFAAVVYFYKNFDMTVVKQYIQQNPHRSRIISLAVFFLASFTFIPSSPLTVFLSITYSPQFAIGLSGLGNTLGAIVQYYIGTHLTSLENLEGNKEKLPHFLRGLPISSPLFLLIGRVIPGGTRGLSVVSGFYHTRFFTFFWTTTLMYFLSAAFQVFGGMELLKLI